MIKAKKNILFTFDYELFLGERSGSVQNCMLKPTEQLLLLFEKHKVSNALFFVDTTYLLRLKKEAQISEKAHVDFLAITKQIQILIQKKHYVFPHIHPHWLDAEYNEKKNEWKLPDLKYYRFHALNETQRTELFDASMALLKEMILPVAPHYQTDGYRAGGWCIQPFQDFLPHFKKHNIKYDFSVLPGIKNLSTAQYFDFTTAPENPIYKFEEDILVQHSTGSFVQFAISVLQIPRKLQFGNKLLLKYLWKTGNRSIGDGSGVVSKQINLLEKETNPKNEMVSFELLTSLKLPLYKAFLNRKGFMHFISHPKMLSKHNFKCVDQFLKTALKKYSIETDFKKMLGEK
jgi:hypothetical protein